MFAEVNVERLGEAESAAKKILEHIEAIRELQLELGTCPIKVSVDLDDGKSETASGN